MNNGFTFGNGKKGHDFGVAADNAETRGGAGFEVNAAKHALRDVAESPIHGVGAVIIAHALCIGYNLAGAADVSC